MQIYVDADACPKAAKEILYRVAERRKLRITFVTNQYLTLPKSDYLVHIQVKQGFDVADKEIVDLMERGDLVITADIPLADAVVKQGGTGLNPRGELYTSENIGGIRSTRDFLATMRDSGMEVPGGQAAYNARDRQEFANQLDRFLTAELR